MTALQQVIAEPLTIYIRSFSGTKPAIPAVDRTPAQIVAAGWDLLGGSQLKRDGVRVALTPGFATFMGANSTKVDDRWLVSEEAVVEFSLVDLSMETMAVALDQTVSTMSGPPNYKELGMGRPRDLKRWSVLARGRTPDNLTADNDKWRMMLLWDCQVTSPYEERPSLDNPGEIPFQLSPLALDGEPEEEKYGIVRAWTS